MPESELDVTQALAGKTCSEAEATALQAQSETRVMTNPNPGTPLASNLFGPSRLTRPSTGYEPKPASEEEEARLVPFAQPSPQQPEPLGGIRPFNPEGCEVGQLFPRASIHFLLLLSWLVST